MSFCNAFNFIYILFATFFCYVLLPFCFSLLLLLLQFINCLFSFVLTCLNLAFPLVLCCFMRWSLLHHKQKINKQVMRVSVFLKWEIISIRCSLLFCLIFSSQIAPLKLDLTPKHTSLPPSGLLKDKLFLWQLIFPSEWLLGAQ